ncbi:MAG: cytochrome c1 [Thiohalomonadales bacterium]
MKYVISSFVAVLLIAGSITFASAYASSNGLILDAANIDPNDKKSLRNGAKIYVDYCLGCHSLSFMRYSRIAKDLDISEDDINEQLIFTGAKFADPMKIAMQAGDASRWFGTQPPDLSVVSRSRSVDWLYTYLRSFYQDESRPWGVNNSVYKDVAMPHVLWELQGLQERIVKTSHDNNEQSAQSQHSSFRLVQTGKQTATEFDRTVRDIVNFLHYVGEPSKAKREALGSWVIGFLFIFLVVVYLLKKEYWKDIH